LHLLRLLHLQVLLHQQNHADQLVQLGLASLLAQLALHFPADLSNLAGQHFLLRLCFRAVLVGLSALVGLLDLVHLVNLLALLVLVVLLVLLVLAGQLRHVNQSVL
jgi:hypothetical protein